jgi:hypothetical protein
MLASKAMRTPSETGVKTAVPLAGLTPETTTVQAARSVADGAVICVPSAVCFDRMVPADAE